MTSRQEAPFKNPPGEVLKDALLRKIRKLEAFPKMDMFVRSSGKVEQRWGVRLYMFDGETDRAFFQEVFY